MTATVDGLNRLLRAEYGSMLFRLHEASPHVTWTSAGDRLLIDRMMNDERTHERELIDAILDRRGAPAPRNFPTNTGEVHYLDLTYLMPQVLASKRELVRIYESAGNTGDPAADALRSRILDNHRRHLAGLDRLHSDLASTAQRA